MCPTSVITKRKEKSAERALSDLMQQCAKAERSTGDVRRLMSRWGVPASEREGVVEKLIEQRFVDNRRYARAYVRDKLNLSGWGAQRIRLELGRKGVEREVIDETLDELVDAESTRERLREMLIKRRRTVRHKDIYDLKSKLLRYGATLGYDYSMLSDVIAEVVNQSEEAECLDTFF